MTLARWARHARAATTFGLVAIVGSCNALVGNGDIQLGTDAAPADATTSADVAADATDPGDTRHGDDAGTGTGGPSDSPVDGVSLAARCDAGTKACAGKCVSLDDSAYGCGSPLCDPCELPSAFAGCAAHDGGAFTCSVAACKGTHADCNGNPVDGCEIDTTTLENCGVCGHDCLNLAHVAGNVACMAGACAFTSTACAPGYGICTSNPDNGCDTVISEAAHCGGCATSCSVPGFPYCSPTGNAAQPFACTSGCGAGLSLCGASCVDEKSDPNHCGSCATQCPAVAGGTPTCSAGGKCGFLCNANDHSCGAAPGSTCASNTDPLNCGVGAACGTCPALANATAACTGGTTCSFACTSNAHPCGQTCPLNSDPNNCGSVCGTNCPGPTAGSGTGAATCSGDTCAITCTGGSSLCATACIDEQSDSAHCGSCENACPAGQSCISGSCTCNATSCPGGCCDGNGVCRSAPACGTAGAACVAGCPVTIPEASKSLVLWLVGDGYTSGASTWSDQSGKHADATCPSGSCPTSGTAAAIGHRAVAFSGSSFFALSDPAAQYTSQTWTLFVVANASATATTSGAQLLSFASGANVVDLQRSGTSGDLLFQVLPGSTSSSLVAPGAWGGWEIVVANVDATNASLSVAGATPVTGAIGAPANVDYSTAYLGTDPWTTVDYAGQVAEVLVFTADLSASSISKVRTYLASRYGL